MQLSMVTQNEGKEKQNNREEKKPRRRSWFELEQQKII